MGEHALNAVEKRFAYTRRQIYDGGFGYSANAVVLLRGGCYGLVHFLFLFRVDYRKAGARKALDIGFYILAEGIVRHAGAL